MKSFGEKFDELLLNSTGGSEILETEVVQELWSGYGKIVKVYLSDFDARSVIVKHVQMPDASNHPRGWNTSISHNRKVKSYEVESNWYRRWAQRCAGICRIPQCYASEQAGNEIFLILEDLDQSGFPVRLSHVSRPQIEICLRWLAEFHATFMQQDSGGLWKVGTYWHLDTRPDELDALDDPSLKSAAKQIDECLKSAKYQTIVHGDAKLANFCFSEGAEEVAAVDFQYVGGGCGMKDVAYFIGSCRNESACEEQENTLLSIYFDRLENALKRHHPGLSPEKIIEEWYQLFPVAWTDFHRFLKGWCPGHWKINHYSERVAGEVIRSLNH